MEHPDATTHQASLSQARATRDGPRSAPSNARGRYPRSLVSDALRIAVLGDVHGHLTLAFRVLRRWQDETGLSLDLILHVGELGRWREYTVAAL